MIGWPLPKPLSERQANAALVILGAASLVLYCKGVHDQGAKRIATFAAGALTLGVPYFLMAWVILRARAARSTWIIGLIFAAAFRLAALNTTPYLSTDLYRYIWDGRVQAAGINPYRFIPADEHLAHLRDDAIYPYINRKSYAKTVYPPLAEAVFLAVTRFGETPLCIRLTLIFFEAVTLWALVKLLASFGLPPHRALLCAWHPLTVWEFSGGGHVDAIMMAFVALAWLAHRRGREALTGGALACAALAKLFPVVLIPALYRRWRWGWKMPLAFAATMAVAYAPYLLTDPRGMPGSLGSYASEEGLHTGDRFYLMNLLPSGALHAAGIPAYGSFVGLVILAMAGAGSWAFWRRDHDELSPVRRCLCLAAIFAVALSPGYGWYYSWLVPFLCLLPYPWLFWLTVSPMVLYLNWLHYELSDVYLQNSFICVPAAFLGLWQVYRIRAARRFSRPDALKSAPENARWSSFLSWKRSPKTPVIP